MINLKKLKNIDIKNSISYIKKKKITRTHKLGTALALVILMSFIIGARTADFTPEITDFTVSPSPADVGEPVEINWTIMGSFDLAVISFGDGNQTQMTMVQENDSYSLLHEYKAEGKYNVSIYAAYTGTGYEVWDARFITIENTPPEFDLTVVSEADEDEYVSISVSNLQESDHDKEVGVLSYIYDFADGNQTDSDYSSILHKWENAGTYPLTVTVIDDQGALNQRTHYIDIVNANPIPDFTVGSEIPATHGFYSDPFGSFPIAWNSGGGEHYPGSFSFEYDLGLQGTSIGFIDKVSSGSSEVIYIKDGHDTALKLWSNADITHNFNEARLFGKVEFWYYAESNTVSKSILLKDGDTTRIELNAASNGKWSHHDGTQTVYNDGYNSGEWYHHLIEWESNNRFNWFVNGDIMVDRDTMKSNVTDGDGINNVNFTSSTEAVYIDGYGEVWEEEYNTGRNEIPSTPSPFMIESFNVVEKEDDHQKILQVTASEFAALSVYNSFNTRSYGTVEYYYMTENVNEPIGYVALGEGSSEKIAVFTKNGKWYYRADGGSDVEITELDIPPINDEWYHVRIDFRGANGEYMGLADDKFRVIIDGEILSTTFDYSGDSIDRVNIESVVGTDVAYLDAIGYSWDSNYKVGDNYHPFEESYYASFDFRTDIIGLQPEDWTVNSPENIFIVMDEGYYFNEVVEIFDNDTSSASMEHQFNDVQTGTIEFWINSENAGVKTWTFGLLNEDTTSLFVGMDQYLWKYSENGQDFYIIGGISAAPANDTWYHLRLDFRADGAPAYLGLGNSQFTLTVDGDQSNMYDIGTVSSINKTMVTSGLADYGVAFIDAIGYSWDQYYSISDNELPTVNYPEKSDIFFSASHSTDTESDQNSLDYYWDFGDGSSGFGKYAIHEYLVSGMYPVTLTCMDDNGNESSIVKVVLVSNNYPIINFTYEGPTPIVFYEGDRFDISTIVWDEDADVSMMSYYWHIDEPGFDPYNVEAYDEGGWVNNLLFTDNNDQLFLEELSVILLPNETRLSELWYCEPTGGELHEKIDDTGTETEYIRTDVSQYLSSGFEFGFEDYQVPNGAIVTSVTLFVKAKKDDDTDYLHPEFSLRSGSSDYGNMKPFIDDAGYEWYEIPWNGLSLTQDDVNDLHLFEITDTHEGFPPNGQLYIDAMYLNLTIESGRTHERLFVLAKDPEGAFSFDSLNVTVLNADPTVSVRDLAVPTNITFEVDRSTIPSYDNNFTFYLEGTDEFGLIHPLYMKNLNFTGLADEETTVNHEYQALLSLNKDWKVRVNSSSTILGTIDYTITLDFLDEQQEIVLSGQFGSGVYAAWNTELNSLFYDATNYTAKHPLSTKVSVWDPSQDDVSLTVNYTTNMLLEISTSEPSLPITQSFSYNGAWYEISAYEFGGRKYAQINATTEIASEAFNDNAFPVDIIEWYALDPIIDLNYLLGPSRLNLDSSITECLEANNYLEAKVVDDDGGADSIAVEFSTLDEIVIRSMCPDTDQVIFNDGVMTTNLTFYLEYYYETTSREGSGFYIEEEPIYVFDESIEESNPFNNYGSQASFTGPGYDYGYDVIGQNTDSGADDEGAWNVNGGYDDWGNGGTADYSVYYQTPLGGTDDNNNGWETPVGQVVTGATNGVGTYPIDVGDYTPTSWTYSGVNPGASGYSSKATSGSYANHYPGTNLAGTYSWYGYGPTGDVPYWDEWGEGGGQFIQISSSISGHDDVAQLHRSGANTAMRFPMSYRDDGYLEFWVRWNGADFVFQLLDVLAAWKMSLQFQSDGLWEYQDGGLFVGWRYIKIFSGVTDNNWYRFAVDWDDSANSVQYWIWNEAGSLLYERPAVGMRAPGADPVFLWMEARDAVGDVFIDGVCLEYASTPTLQGANKDPMQTKTHDTNFYFSGMNDDTYRRLGDFKVRLDAAFSSQNVKADIYAYHKTSGWIYKGTKSGTTVNDLTAEFSPTEKDNYIYRVDHDSYYIKIRVIAYHNNYQTINLNQFTIDEYDVKPLSWYYFWLYGNSYHHNGGMAFNAGYVVTAPGTQHQIDHATSVTYSAQFDITEPRGNVKIQLWDHVEHNTWETIHNYGTFSGTKDINNEVVSAYYVDPDDGSVDMRIISDAGEASTLRVDDFSAKITWAYTYDSEFEIHFNDMSTFRRDFFTSAQIDYDVYTSMARTVDVQIRNWAGGWEDPATGGDFSTVEDVGGSGSLTFTDNKYINSGTGNVRVRFLVTDSEFSIDAPGDLDHKYSYVYGADTHYEVKLVGMNEYRRLFLDDLEVHYSITTSVAQTNLQIWAHDGVDWGVPLDTFNTVAGVPEIDILEITEGTLGDYLYYSGGEYYVKVRFTGMSETEFDDNSIVVEYEYSSRINNEFQITLDGMTDYKRDYLDYLNVSYSITTSLSRNVDLQAEKAGSGWQLISQFVTNAGTPTTDSEVPITVGDLRDYVWLNGTLGEYVVRLRFVISGGGGTTFVGNYMEADYHYKYDYDGEYELDLATDIGLGTGVSFDGGDIDFEFNTLVGQNAAVYLWDYNSPGYVYIKDVTGGPGATGYVTLAANSDYVSNTYNVSIKFVVSDTEFDLINLTADWTYNYSYNDKYEGDVALIPFERDGLTSGTVEYQIDLPNDNSVGSGNYPATYSFDKEVGSNPEGWTVNEPTDTSVEVINSRYEHNEVLLLADDSYDNALSAHKYIDGEANGVVDLWFRMESEGANDKYWYQLGSTAGPFLRFYSNQLYYYNRIGTVITICTYEQDRWYHLSVDFDCASDTFDIYLDGELKEADLEFRYEISEVDRISFSSSTTQCYIDAKLYIDAIGYTGEGYVVGDNFVSADHYRGTYSFEEDLVGSNPSGWTTTEGTDCSVDVISVLDGHENVLEFRDDSVTEACDSYNDFSSPQTDGVIEFWWRLDGNLDAWNEYFRCYLYDSNDNIAVQILFNYQHAGDISYYNGTDYLHIVTGVEEDRWYRITIDFDCTTDTFDFYLDGELKGNDIAFRIARSNIDRIYFGTRTTSLETEYINYIDAVSYDWDTDYTVGDNEVAVPVVDVYLYDFTGSEWDYFKTTIGGDSNINDAITFYSNDYVESGTNNVRLMFSGFLGSRFNLDWVDTYIYWMTTKEVYRIDIPDASNHRVNALDNFNVTWSLRTSLAQTGLQLKLWNFVSSEWTSVGDPFSANEDEDTFGSFVFNDGDFIQIGSKQDYYFKFIISGLKTYAYANYIAFNYSWSDYLVNVDFGDGEGRAGEPSLYYSSAYRNVYNATHVYDRAGEYLVTWTTGDALTASIDGELVSISYSKPLVSIGRVPNRVIEDQHVTFDPTIEFEDEDVSESEYVFFWDFGDGHHSVDRSPTYAWADNGSYTVTLTVKDLYGFEYIDSLDIEIQDRELEIVGPYSFYGTEGQGVLLDIGVIDSIKDKSRLTYRWYDGQDQEIDEFYNNRKPVVVLNDGVHEYTLKVKDDKDVEVEATIIVRIDDLPVKTFVSPRYMYQGDVDSGTITLSAYGFDVNHDINNLKFEWKITHDDTIYEYGPYTSVNRSTIQFDVDKSAIYQGTVTATDQSNDVSNTATFIIVSTIDSNGNGFSDEFEAKLAENGENIYDYSDSDNDGLSDIYELSYNITYYLDPDSDGDGLYDGINKLTGIGEFTAGTLANNSDCDSDGLSDGEEIMGWTITTDRDGDIFVFSDPWDNDTDGDNLSDAEEKTIGTNPLNKDTDYDGLFDNEEIDLGTDPLRADGDKDGLLDKEEVDLGTDSRNFDSDADGLYDGDEVLGLSLGVPTNPLMIDSDRDFLDDSVEIQDVTASLDKKVNVSKSILLSIDEYFKKAVTAHLRVVLSFGEVGGGYGVVDVPDIKVKIVKDGVTLMDNDTKGTRYFSQELDFKETIESKGKNYGGDYMLYTSDPEAGCVVDEFEIVITRHLDPNNDDIDGDGIMDGVERRLIERGKQVYNYTSFVNNNVNTNQISTPFEGEIEGPEVSSTKSGTWRDTLGMFDCDAYKNTWVGIPFNNEDSADDIYVQNENDVDVEVGEDGKYLVLYGLHIATPTDSSRYGFESRVTLAGTEVKGSYSSGYICNTNNDDAFLNGGAIIEATSSQDVRVELVYRTNNGNDANVLVADDSYFQIIQLDDSWDYFRAYETSSTSIIEGAWSDVTWEGELEKDDGSFTHVANSAEIELEADGHYLAISGLGIWQNSKRSAQQVRLTLNDVAIESSYGYSFIRDTKGHEEGNPTSFTVFEASANNVLKVQGRHDMEDNTNTLYTLLEKTGVMIVKLPDGGDYYRGHGDDNIDPSVSTSYGLLDMVDTEDEEDSESFDGDAAGTVNIDADSDYLIFFSGEGTRSSTSSEIRDTTQVRLFVTGAESTYGGGWYDRGEVNGGTFEGGTSFGCLQSLTDTDYLDFRGRRTGDNGAGQFEGDQYGVSIVNLKSLFPSPIVHENVSEPEYEVDTFTINIPDIGRIYDANLTLSISSNDTPLGFGDFNFTLVKKDINCSIDDVVLIDHSESYNANDVSYQTFLYLADYINDDTIDRFSGEYILNILITNNATDVFNVTAYVIEIDTYVESSKSSLSWNTNPALADSDYDGISDYDEINGWTRGSNEFYTSPIDFDSDGDGIEDFFDRDPLGNVMLRLSPQSASFRNMWFDQQSPLLEIVMKWDDNYIPSQKVRATEELWSWTDWFGTTWSRNMTTNFVTANEGAGVHYSIDISDHKDYYWMGMNFLLQLWQVSPEDPFGNRLFDTFVFAGWDTASIGDVGTYDIIGSSQQGVFGFTNELSVKVEVVSVAKANTIAIYDNATAFNGHYHEQEKMNIFILDVNGDVSGTPFVVGTNAIVIPTRIFYDTELNGYVQDGQIDATVLYSEDENEYRFISMGRNGTTAEGNKYIDFIIYREDLTATEAMNVLDMFLMVYVNDSSSELEEINRYVSSKLDEIDPALLNIEDSVMSFIPWIVEEDSERGFTPRTWWQIILDGFAYFMRVWMDGEGALYRAVGQGFKEWWDTIFVPVILAQLLEDLTTLAAWIWLIVRAIIIVFFYILIIIPNVILNTIMVCLEWAQAWLLSAIQGFTVPDLMINVVVLYAVPTMISQLKIDYGGYTVTTERWILWNYWPAFDMYIPEPWENLIEEEIDDDIDDPPVIIEGTAGFQNASDVYEFNAAYSDSEGVAPDYLNVHLISPSEEESVYAMAMSPFYDNVNWSDPVESQTMYKSGVYYNRTIAFSSFEKGQWFYYLNFSDGANEVIYPNDVFALGPNTQEESVYLMAKLGPYESAVWENEMCNFSVRGLELHDGVYASNVDLVLALPDASMLAISMVNVSSKNTLDFDPGMDPSSVIYDKWITEFFVSVNMSEAYDFTKSITNIGYYFNASLTNGKASSLVSISSYTTYDAEDDEYLDIWLDYFYRIDVRSIGKDGMPKIVDYKIEELLTEQWWEYGDTINYRTGQYSTISLVKESILRFSVWIRDEDGTHEETYAEEGFTFAPIIKMRDMDTVFNGGGDFEMEMLWDRYDEEKEADVYWVDLSGCGLSSSLWEQNITTGLYMYQNTTFRSGAWEFTIEITDNDDNTAEMQANHKLWNMGSMTTFLGTIFGEPAFNIEGQNQYLGLWGQVISLGAFVVSSVAMIVSHWYPPARYIAYGATIFGVAIDFASKIPAVIDAFLNADPLALLGVTLHTIVDFAMVVIAKSVRNLILTVASSWNTPAEEGGRILLEDEVLTKGITSVGSKIIKTMFRITAALNMIVTFATNPNPLEMLFGIAMVALSFGGNYGRMMAVILGIAQIFAGLIPAEADVDDPLREESEAKDQTLLDLNGELISNIAEWTRGNVLLPVQMIINVVQSFVTGASLGVYSVLRMKGRAGLTLEPQEPERDPEPTNKGFNIFLSFNLGMSVICGVGFMITSDLFLILPGLARPTTRTPGDYTFFSALLTATRG